jgi:hypothetical protein
MAVVAAIIIGGATLIGAGASIYTANKAAGTAEDAQELARDNMDVQERIAGEQLAFQKEQQVKLDAQKKKYSEYQFSNPYENMENVYEDLTVNQDQANFEKQMFQQGQANIMQDLRGVAGSSGVAGLAQALSQQGQLASQQASISIGQQEQANQKMALQAAAANEMAERGGEAQVQQQEMSRNATLLGVEMGGMAGANAGVQQAYANQMSAGASAVGALSAQSAAQYGMAGTYMQAGMSVAGMGMQAYGAYMGGK